MDWERVETSSRVGAKSPENEISGPSFGSTISGALNKDGKKQK